MRKDAVWSVFFSDEKRYADFINGIALGGEEVVRASDIHERDSRVILKLWPWERRQYVIKARDMIRRVIFGANFIIIGLENQDNMDYAYPVRDMIYDVGEYEKQLRKIRRWVRHNRKGLSPGEQLYCFRKTDRLRPVVTFLLYTGEEPWNEPRSLHDIIDFTDIPEGLRQYVSDYKVNVIDIRRLNENIVFHTDLKYVVEYMRCADDASKLRELTENEPYFKRVEADAYDVLECYANKEIEISKEKYESEGRINMCKALQDWARESREEGRKVGLEEGHKAGLAEGQQEGRQETTVHFIIGMYRDGCPIDQIIRVSGESEDDVRAIIDKENV